MRFWNLKMLKIWLLFNKNWFRLVSFGWKGFENDMHSFNLWRFYVTKKHLV